MENTVYFADSEMMKQVNTTLDVMFADCEADVQREEAFVRDPSLSAFELDQKLAPPNSQRELERKAVELILKQASINIAEKFEHLGKMRDIMAENYKLENAIFDVLKGLNVEIVANEYYSTEDGERHQDMLKFEGEYAKGAYSLQQLAQGLHAAKILMERVAGANGIISNRNSTLEEQVEKLKKDVADLKDMIKEKEVLVTDLSKRPNLNVVQSNGFILYNADAKKAVIAGKTVQQTVSTETVGVATVFKTESEALAFKAKMLKYKSVLMEKFGDDWKENSKLKVKNPHKYVCVSVLLVQNVG